MFNNTNITPFALDTDSYKVTQWKQFPKTAEYAMSYFESRSKDRDIVFFGLQMILNQLVPPTCTQVWMMREVCQQHFGSHDVFNHEGWFKIAEMGYYPLEIKAVAEGTVVPSGNVLFTIENTEPGFVWLLSWFETQLMRVWYPCSVATHSRDIKKIIVDALERTGTPEMIEYKLHDFGSRGVSSADTAAIGGAAHLVNFKGTDTLAGWMAVFDSYLFDDVLKSQVDPGTIGHSIPASEHSTITSWGADFEIDAFRNMIEQFGKPGALYACVSDSYDIWKALEKWKELEPLILEKGGTLVVRPDSGDPVHTPVEVVEKLLDLFGHTTNAKGCVVLPDHIRVIQGDGLDEHTIQQILEELYLRGISADNIAFGMGGQLLQNHMRDDYKFALKMCWLKHADGTEIDVYKDPVTDPGKQSKRGRLMLLDTMETVTYEKVSELEMWGHAILDTVYYNGEITRQSFSEIRKRAEL